MLPPELAALLPQLLAGGEGPTGPGGSNSPLGVPVVPPGAPLPPGMPGPANAMLPGSPPPGVFPQPTANPPGGPGGALLPPSPDGGGGSAPNGQGMPSPGGAALPPPEYDTATQQDGSVLMFLKNPDGTRGPAVKIISPPKRGLNREAAMAQVK